MNKKIIIVLSLISIISIIFLFYLQKQNNKNISDFVPTKLKDINNIKIGSTKEEIEKEIGKEISSTQSADLTISKYKSDNIYRPHQIYFKNKNSELIIEEITNGSMTTDKMRQESGLAENILYEKREHSTFNLYVYPNKGISYKGHANGGLVLEIWRFQPTDIKSFIKNFAPNYQENPYTTKSGY